VIGEFDIYGVYVPIFLIFAGVAFLLQWAVRRLFDSWGLYRFVWHRPLFDLAIYVILLGAVTAAGFRLLPLT
jgi:Protein of unknown function (DUF1656)